MTQARESSGILATLALGSIAVAATPVDRGTFLLRRALCTAETLSPSPGCQFGCEQKFLSEARVDANTARRPANERANSPTTSGLLLT